MDIRKIAYKVKKAADFNFANGKIEVAKALYAVLQMLNELK